VYVLAHVLGLEGMQHSPLTVLSSGYRKLALQIGGTTRARRVCKDFSVEGENECLERHCGQEICQELLRVNQHCRKYGRKVSRTIVPSCESAVVFIPQLHVSVQIMMWDDETARPVRLLRSGPQPCEQAFGGSPQNIVRGPDIR
jgi:hypothetical protein